MQDKIFIYGVPGSGKTSLSYLLHKELGIPLLEADSLRPIAQKNTTETKDPFLFVGTCQAYKYFGEISQENCIKGLGAVRQAMSAIVENEIQKQDRAIFEGAFLDPNILDHSGKMILIVTTDEIEHKKHFFEHRPENQDTTNEFRSARLVQEYLIEEAKNLSITVIDNEKDIESVVKDLI